MTILKKMMALPIGLISVIFLASSLAQAVDIQWSGTTCFTMDGSFYLCKPDDKWDTQKTEEPSRPVKLVYHKKDSNPIMWISYDLLATASSSSDYANNVRSRYESRGIKDIIVTKEVVGGRDIPIVSGLDESKGARFSTALFWRSGMKKALQIEYTASAQDFSTYQPQFLATIASVRDLR